MMKNGFMKTMFFICLLIIPAMLISSPVMAKTIELTINNHNPAASTISKAHDAWAQWVEEKSNGGLKMTVHHGGSLLKGNEAFRGVTTNVVDIAHYVIDRKDGFLLSTVTALPFLGMPPQKKAGKLYWELLNMFPEMMDEWKGIKIISLMQMPASHIHTTKLAIKTPDDIKGVKVFTPEVAVSEAIDAMGGVPVHLDIADMYMSTDRGLVEALMLHFPVMFVFGVGELTKYHTVFGDGGINMTPMFQIMNQEEYDSLPGNLRQVLDESNQIWHDRQLELDQGFQKVAEGSCREKGDTFIELTNDDIALWRDRVKGPVHEKWIKQAEDKGLPGRKVYDEMVRLIGKYNKM